MNRPENNQASGPRAGRRISLVGMSGAGKTYLSQSLQSMGFERVSVDERIEDRLRDELPPDQRGLQVVANWVGFPEDPWYAERSRRYLELEESVLSAELHRLATASPKEIDRYVLDTTGSVVYLEDRLLSRLRSATTVIHLETPAPIRREMYADFMAKPTPLIWRSPTDPEGDSVPEKASGESFLQLIEAREEAYRALAHKTLGYEERRSADFDFESRFFGE